MNNPEFAESVRQHLYAGVENVTETPLATAKQRPRATLFKPGNQAAKGRKNPLFRLREVVRRATKPADVRAVFLQLAEKAKHGDTQAAKLFLSYAIGEPNQTIEVTHHDDKLDFPAAIQALLASGASLAAEMQLDVQYLGEK